MAKFGKWVGLGLGWALGGPIGGILGLAVGSIFDSGKSEGPGQARSVRERTLRGDYAASLLVLIAAVMKADGRVMKSELDYVKRYFVTRFGEDTASEAVVMLRDILKQEIPLRDVTHQLSQNFELYFHRQLSPNDENIAFGQLVWYDLQQRLEKTKSEKYVLSHTR